MFGSSSIELNNNRILYILCLAHVGIFFCCWVFFITTLPYTVLCMANDGNVLWHVKMWVAEKSSQQKRKDDDGIRGNESEM